MLTINIPERTWLNDKTNEIFTVKAQTIMLEHSLVSLSKWESKWQKPFLSEAPKSHAESIDYVKCMTVTPNVKDEVYYAIDADIMKKINDYIDSPMTATTFSDKGKRRAKEVITSEIIYYWMIALNIPSEYQKWHLNRLLTLIRVCDIKNTPPKKMSKGEIMRRNTSLNAARRAASNTKG